MRNECVIGSEEGTDDSGGVTLLSQALACVPPSYGRTLARVCDPKLRRSAWGYDLARIRKSTLARGIVLPSWARLRLAVRRYRAYGLPTPIDGIDLPPPVPRPTKQRCYAAGRITTLETPWAPPPIPRGSRARGLRGPAGRGLPLPPKDRRVHVDVSGKTVVCSTRLPRWMEEADRPWVANAREALEAVTPKPVQPMALRFEAVAEKEPDRTQEWAALLEQGRRRLT